MWYDLTHKDCTTSVHNFVVVTARLVPLLSVVVHTDVCARMWKHSRGTALLSELILCFQQSLVHWSTFASPAKDFIQSSPKTVGVLDQVTNTQIKQNKYPRLLSWVKSKCPAFTQIRRKTKWWYAVGSSSEIYVTFVLCRHTGKFLFIFHLDILLELI